MKIEVYGIVEKSTDEIVYVGSSKNLKRRIPGHISKAYKGMSCMPIYEYIRSKCPVRKEFNDMFEFVTLIEEEVENFEMQRMLEQSMIDKYSPVCNKNNAVTDEEEQRVKNNACSREWRNREENKDYFREWHEKNPDWYKDWNAKHPDYQKEWRKAHPDYFKEWHRNHPGYAKAHAGKNAKNDLNLSGINYI